MAQARAVSHDAVSQNLGTVHRAKAATDLTTAFKRHYQVTLHHDATATVQLGVITMHPQHSTAFPGPFSTPTPQFPGNCYAIACPAWLVFVLRVSLRKVAESGKREFRLSGDDLELKGVGGTLSALVQSAEFAISIRS
eukprot:753939-Hanusia_phi.AAC.3